MRERKRQYTGLLMRRSHGWIAVIQVIVILIMLLPAMLPSRAFAKEAQPLTPVRVGYFHNGDFMHKNESGTYEGYDVEYYYTLAAYAGWDLQFVEYGSLTEALLALEQGTIDVMSGLSKTEEREAKFLVSAKKMSTAHIAVQTRSDDDRFSAGDISGMSNLSCGILKKSNVVQLYSDWCTANGLTPHIVEYDSLDLRNAALLSGQVDAVAGSSTIEGAQKIAEFSSLDLYFMFHQNRRDLKAQADRAMSILALQEPNYDEDLFAKYFPLSRNASPSFSAAEKKYIATHKTLRVAMLGNDIPFSVERDGGKVEGILPDYFSHLGEVIGIQFTYVPYGSQNDACQALRAGEVDLVGKFENNIFAAHDCKLMLTRAYLDMNLVQITRAGTETIQRAAAASYIADRVHQIFSSTGNNAETVPFENCEQCFKALRSGAVNAVICTQLEATWLLLQGRASDYVVLPFGGNTWDASGGIPYGADGNMLRSILNKTIAVDDGYINRLTTEEMLSSANNLESIVDRLPVSVLIFSILIALGLLLICVASLIVIVRRRKIERRLSLQQGELRVAEQANQAKHAFFGAVSHDMRTPLNGIVGFTNLAIGSRNPELIQGCLQKIRRCAVILTNLVNDTLVMSRIENGKYELHPTKNDLTELIEEVLEPVRETAQQKGIRFADNLSELRPSTVLVDRLSLQKIFLNLLSNAVRYTPSGGALTMACSLEPSDEGKSEMVITISDTGMGISKEFLPHIFEAFAQENPANADTEGSGIGLSIVKNIVDAMGGRIEVESEQGRGSQFTVHLYLQEEDSVQKKGKEADTYPNTLSGKRVLICEDNLLNLEILKTILEQNGMVVIGAENGKLGVELYQKSEPGYFDLILLDLRMPVMDGLTAARAMRASVRTDSKKIPIYAVSADAYTENVRACLEAGMNGHIAKPIDPDEMIRTLSRALQTQAKV